MHSVDAVSIADSQKSPDTAFRIVLWSIGVLALALFAFALARFFFGGAFPALLNSDAAVSALLAHEILIKTSLFPDSWYYANSEIWTVYPQIFALPFVAWLGPSPLALKLGSMCVILVGLGLFALLVFRVTRSWPYSIIVACGVFACASMQQIQMVYEQPAYGWIAAQLALLIYLSLRLQTHEEPSSTTPSRKHLWIELLYALILANIVVASPLRAVVYWVIPFFIASAFVAVAPRRRSWLRQWLLTGFVLAAGIAVHVLLVRRLSVAPGLTQATFAPIHQWATNVRNLARGVPLLVGFSLTSLHAVSFSAFAESFRWIFLAATALGVFVAALPGFAKNTEVRFFAALSGAMLLTTFGVLTVGNLVSGGGGSERYLLMPMLLCIAAGMTVLWSRYGSRRIVTLAVASVFALGFGGGGISTVAAFGPVAPSIDCDAPASVCRLQSTLLEHGLSEGYATYWNANVTTLASVGKLRVCAIDLKSRIAIVRWLASQDCSVAPLSERFFIALSRAEAAQVDRNALIAGVGQADETMRVGPDYEIRIYTTAKSDLSWLRR